MKNRIIIKIIICLAIILLLVLLGFLIRKIYLKNYEKKLVDINWLRKNISIEENKELFKTVTSF